MITNKEIIKFLTSTTINASFVDKLKIKYRPIICPFNTLLDYAKENTSVFDIGCGSGQFCALVAKFTPVKKIMGIEIFQRLIDNAKVVNKQFDAKELTFEVFDGKTIPDKINEYDLVYMIDVYHHIPKDYQVQFMKNVYAKMKTGSKLIFKDIDAGHPFVYFNKLHDIVFAGEIGNEMSSKTAKKILTECGFKIVEEYKKTSFVYPHYFTICQK
ncbi:MAG: class I SAM-dependent methyltransferase [Bacteroidota bacterium]|nr:class I SAM-dependent methyltransferase [Bacteroidota bacterium]